MHQSRDGRLTRDLLPIIAAVIILLPILACAIHRARDASMQITCAENLKALGVAAEMYQADWDDVLVPYGAPFQWSPNSMWPTLLNRYISPGSTSLGSVFKCPAPASSTDGWAYERTYGMNQKCGGWLPGGTPVVVSVKSVRYPASTIRLAEVSWLAQGGSYFAAQPVNYYPGDPTCHQFATRHNGKGNVLWIDGHVSAMTLEQYNMLDSGPYSGQIWLRLEPPKPSVAN